MNRQQRRAQKNQPKTQAQFDEDVYREGFRDGATSTFKMAYAAVCLVLHRDYGFGQGRCHKVLSALDAEMSPGGQLSDRSGLRRNRTGAQLRRAVRPYRENGGKKDVSVILLLAAMVCLACLFVDKR